MIGLPHARMLCKTCGRRFVFARDLVAHIIAIREAGTTPEAIRASL
jgi:hypothetical protein